jgi:hypothetical protein
MAMPLPVSYPNSAKAMRERLLAQNATPPEAVEVDGQTYYLRTARISDREVIVKRVMETLKLEGGDVDPKSISTDRMMAAAVLQFVCDEAGTPAFEPGDFEAIRTAEVTSGIGKLAELALQKLQPAEKKASATTPSDSGTSSSPASSDAP